jgi:transposase
VLVGEIFHRDFNNRRQLASYIGFAPSPFQSGNVAHEQGISKAGKAYAVTSDTRLAAPTRQGPGPPHKSLSLAIRWTGRCP